MSRLARWHAGYFQQRLSNGAVPCIACRHPAALHLASSAQLPPAFARLPPALPGTYGFWLLCTACQRWSYQTDIIALALFLPAAQRFWRAHPRMRALPPTLCSRPGGEIVLAGFQDLNGPARLELTFDPASLAVLQLQGNTLS